MTGVWEGGGGGVERACYSSYALCVRKPCPCYSSTDWTGLARGLLFPGLFKLPWQRVLYVGTGPGHGRASTTPVQHLYSTCSPTRRFASDSETWKYVSIAFRECSGVLSTFRERVKFW